MKNNTLELLVGTFVLAGIIAIAYLAINIAGGSLLGNDSYRISATFEKVTGLTKGSNVVIAGVPVGKVESIRLNPEKFNADVSLRVSKAVRLSSESTASIKTSGLIGDRYILIEPGADDTLIPDDNTGTLSETHAPLDIEDLISRFAFGSIKTENGNSTANTTVETK